jgi:two-component system, cell cycle response regulator
MRASSSALIRVARRASGLLFLGALPAAALLAVARLPRGAQAPSAGVVGLCLGIAICLALKRPRKAEAEKAADAPRPPNARTSMNGLAPVSRRTPDSPVLDGAGGEAGYPSGLDEVQSTLRAALDVCRLAIGCRSVLALSLDASRRWLFLRERSTRELTVCPGPFSAAEGVFAAALHSGRLAELVSGSAARQVSYYKSALSVGHVAAHPFRSEDGIEGLLAFDRAIDRPFNDVERELVRGTAEIVQSTLQTERSVRQLDRAKAEQSKLYRAVEQLSEAKSELQVIQAGVGSAGEFAAFHFAAVTLLRQGGEHEICAVSGPGAEELAGKTFRDNTGLVGMVVETRHALPFRGGSETGKNVIFTRALSSPHMRSLLVLPLMVHQDVLGTLVLGSSEVGAFASSVRPTLEVLARHIAVSLANARMMKRLEDLATTDGLTGLLNKRALLDVARQKLRSATRFKKPLSVLVCDLDHFKRVNDTHGHDAGDRVIQGFADVLKRMKRDTDVVGRFGGEEFVVVCEQTDLVGAKQLAERLRGDLEHTVFPVSGENLRVTCSIGVAAFPQAGSQWEDLFRATDEALYASKHAGRNAVTVWTPKHAKAG